MTCYINMKSSYGVETIDEFSTRREAFKMLKEYRIADNSQHYYLSQRATNDWRNK